MSIDVRFIYGTPASIPSASETVAGKIRLATSAEATAGINDLTAMTPAKVKAVIDASIAGGVTYRGTFDAGSPTDLSNAVQGDLYIISGAGTYAGRSWAVGDHLLVNADMGGTFDSAKIDKIDSTDAVTSVAGRTGAVTLSASDISGLATVATSGAYSDLSGLPTLGTAAALDVGTTALKVVQLDASAKLPAVDGSQLTNLPSAPVTSVAGRTGAITLSASDISGLATVATSGAYSDLSGLPTLGTAAALDVGTTALKVVQLDASAKLPAVDGSQLTNIVGARPAVSTSTATSLSISVPTGNETFHLLNPSGACTVTLASPTSGTDNGRLVNIKNLSASTISINAAATIDGASSFSISIQYASVTLLAYNGAWYIV